MLQLKMKNRKLKTLRVENRQNETNNNKQLLNLQTLYRGKPFDTKRYHDSSLPCSQNLFADKRTKI